MASAPLTPARAYDLEVEVVQCCSVIKSAWVRLAGRLHEFHRQQAWTLRSFGSFDEWIAQPEIGLGRSQARFLVEAWRELVLERGADVEALACLDMSKVQIVLPAVRKGDVELIEALADCASMSKSDLIAEYRDSNVTEKVKCPSCGTYVTPGALAA